MHRNGKSCDKRLAKYVTAADVQNGVLRRSATINADIDSMHDGNNRANQDANERLID